MAATMAAVALGLWGLNRWQVRSPETFIARWGWAARIAASVPCVVLAGVSYAQGARVHGGIYAAAALALAAAGALDRLLSVWGRER